MDAIRGKNDAFGSMVAGALTGALFKSTGGCLAWCQLLISTRAFSFPPAGVKPALAADHYEFDAVI